MSSMKTVSVVGAVAEGGKGWKTLRSCHHRATVVSVSAVAGNSGDEGA